MARGGARPGAGRKAGKSANTSPVSARAPDNQLAITGSGWDPELLRLELNWQGPRRRSGFVPAAAAGLERCPAITGVCFFRASAKSE